MHSEDLDSLIFAIATLLRRRYEDWLKPNSLTYTQARALLYLEHHPGCRQVDLARRLGLKASSLGNMMEHLEVNSLIARQPAHWDRRAHQLFLASHSADTLPALKAVIGRTNEKALDSLSSDEVSLLMNTLGQIRRNLNADPQTRL